MSAASLQRIDLRDLDAQIVPPAAITPQQRALWSSMLRTGAADGDPFLSHAYISAVAAVRPGVHVAVIGRGGEIDAFFAFQFPTLWHRLVGQGAPPGGHLTDAFGVVCGTDFRITPAQLLPICGIHYIAFSHLPAAQRGAGLSGATSEAGAPIDLSMGWENYYGDLCRRRRQIVSDLDRRRRNLVSALGPLHFCFAEPHPQNHVHNVIAGKIEQYRRTGVADALADQWSRDLLVRLANGDDPDCRGIVSTLHAGETWVSSHFGLLGRNRLHYWFPVYNPALRRYAPGHLLLWEIMRQAGAHGVIRIERGTGTQPWKRLFANTVSSHDRGDWRQPGLRGQIGRVAAALAWRRQAWLK